MDIPKIETKSLEEIRAFQNTELKKQLTYLQQKSVFYSSLFKKHQVDIHAAKTLDDLKHIPPTTKEDLQLHGTILSAWINRKS